MSQRTVFCIAPSREGADRIVHDLKEAEFFCTDISVLFLDRSANEKRASANGASAPKSTATPRSAGVIRGMLGWIAGIGPRVIPGVDPLIAAGPIADALSGATGGGVADGLIDFGVPQLEAGRYEARINEGHILISVHTENPDMGDRAREIFLAAGAENICTLMKVSAPKIQSRNAYGRSRSRTAFA